VVSGWAQDYRELGPAEWAKVMYDFQREYAEKSRGPADEFKKWLSEPLPDIKRYQEHRFRQGDGLEMEIARQQFHDPGVNFWMHAFDEATGVAAGKAGNVMDTIANAASATAVPFRAVGKIMTANNRYEVVKAMDLETYKLPNLLLGPLGVEARSILQDGWSYYQKIVKGKQAPPLDPGLWDLAPRKPDDEVKRAKRQMGVGDRVGSILQLGSPGNYSDGDRVGSLDDYKRLIAHLIAKSEEADRRRKQEKLNKRPQQNPQPNCEKCQRLVSGKCRGCDEDGMVCDGNGRCVEQQAQPQPSPSMPPSTPGQSQTPDEGSRPGPVNVEEGNFGPFWPKNPFKQ